MEKEYFINGKIVGHLFEDKIYRRQADSKKHKMKIYDGYGIEEEIIQDLKERGCVEVRIKELDTGRLLKTPFSEWLEHGIVADHGSVQRFLPLKHFEEYGIKNK